MTIRSPHSETAQRVRDNLVPSVDYWQSVTPDCLITRGFLCQAVASGLDVSRQATSRHIVNAVSEGRLLEIRPLPDWRVVLPEGSDLPELYAVPVDGLNERAPSLYRLGRKRPESRGSGRVSFLISPKRLKALVAMVRRQYGVPAPDGLVYYAPGDERQLRSATYQELKEALIASGPETLTASQADDMLETVLKVLRLKAPSIE